MSTYHKNLSGKKWNNFSFSEQMANIGCEVVRAINWKNKKNNDYSKLALFRSLELLDLTVADNKNITKLKELSRLREVLVDYFMFENIYKSSDKLWQSYFLPFNIAARLNY